MYTLFKFIDNTHSIPPHALVIRRETSPFAEFVDTTIFIKTVYLLGLSKQFQNRYEHLTGLGYLESIFEAKLSFSGISLYGPTWW